MENRIVTAVFKGSKNTKVSDVWQWDYGQILRIQGLNLPTAVEVDFAVAGASESISRIGTTKDGVTDVVIPDSLIETGNNLVAYIYLRDAESGNTEYQIDMIVTKRAKPEAYDTPEDKELFGQAIEAVNAAADRAEKAGKTAQEAATKTGQDAEQTAQDRVEVAKMVETVTDISEQVKKVEDLSNKAQAAATKTEADAQQTAEDRVEVGKMLETVKDVSEQVKTVEESVRKAKESEQAAEGHRTAVEEMKNSVEQTVSGITQVVQTGVQEINSAKQSAVQEVTQTGTAQKTAVESAGTQAVENVENVKASATEAVETAKTEAVQSVQTEGTKQTGNVSAEGAKQIKEVQDKGAEVLQSIPEDFATQMETKLNKQQGIENKGKVLVIGEDGNVVPEEVASGGGDGIAIINTMSGESPLVIPDSAERVNKRLELVGKTEQNQDPPPSPEYPQEIKNSGKRNEGTQKYEVEVTINSSNLFKVTEHTTGYYVDKDGKVQITKSLGYSWTAVVNNLHKQTVILHITTAINTRYRMYCTDLEDTILYKYEDSSANTNDNSHTFNMPDGAKKIYVSVLEINSAEQAEIALNLGNTALPFEPYKEQTLTLTSDRPITKWDRLVEQGGEIGWLYGSVIATIDETASISLYAPNGFFIHVKNIDKKEKTGYCDKLYTKKMSNGEPFVLFGIANNNFLYTLNTQEFYGKTASEIKAKLKEYPLNIIGKSETTEFVPLPQSEQNAIRALKTYYPTTVITVDGGELDPDIKATYTADTKNYIDNKASAKVASIIRQYRLNTANLLSLMPMETQAAMIENDTNNILENAEEMKHE